MQGVPGLSVVLHDDEWCQPNLDSLVKSLCRSELERTYPRLGTIYSLCSVYYPNIR